MKGSYKNKCLTSLVLLSWPPSIHAGHLRFILSGMSLYFFQFPLMISVAEWWYQLFGWGKRLFPELPKQVADPSGQDGRSQTWGREDGFSLSLGTVPVYAAHSGRVTQ